MCTQRRQLIFPSLCARVFTAGSFFFLKRKIEKTGYVKTRHKQRVVLAWFTLLSCISSWVLPAAAAAAAAPPPLRLREESSRFCFGSAAGLCFGFLVSFLDEYFSVFTAVVEVVVSDSASPSPSTLESFSTSGPSTRSLLPPSSPPPPALASSELYISCWRGVVESYVNHNDSFLIYKYIKVRWLAVG